VAPLRRAAELSQDETGPRRAGSLSDLATAYFESGDLEAASREFARAIDLRLSPA
jgi:Flp pilus assembly protein TadD